MNIQVFIKERDYDLWLSLTRLPVEQYNRFILLANAYRVAEFDLCSRFDLPKFEKINKRLTKIGK